MKLKILLARWIASRIEARMRNQRRALRDHYRLESARIREAEIRSRGLRLYVAWSRQNESNVLHTSASDWQQAAQHAA